MPAPLIQRCKSCGRAYYPHKVRCSCGSAEFDYEALREKGRMITLTTIYVPPLGFEPPLRVGIAEFPQTGIKILGRLVDGDIEVGSMVEAVEENGSVVFNKAGENDSP